MMAQRFNLTDRAKRRLAAWLFARISKAVMPPVCIPTGNGFALEVATGFRLSVDEFWLVLQALRTGEALLNSMSRIQTVCSDSASELGAFAKISHISDSARDYATHSILPALQILESQSERMMAVTKQIPQPQELARA